VIDDGILEKLLAVTIMISSKSMSIWNRFHAKLINSSTNCTFWRGHTNL